MFYNFAAVKPNTLKFPKITYFVVLGNVITCISLKTFAGRPFINVVYCASKSGGGRRENHLTVSSEVIPNWSRSGTSIKQEITPVVAIATVPTVFPSPSPCWMLS